MATKTKNKITAVCVRASIELERFKHIHIEAQISVGAGQTPESAVQDGLDFVAEQLKLAKHGKTVIPSFTDRFKTALDSLNQTGCSIHPRFEMTCYDCKHPKVPRDRSEF